VRAVKTTPERLASVQAPVVYLHGPDRDAMFEAAEALLAAGDPAVTRLRLDVSELERVEVETRSQGLFANAGCQALVRNAEAASPKQGEHLLQLVQDLAPPHRLIICAPEISWKKAMHKKMLAIDAVACCDFAVLGMAAFQRWFADMVAEQGLKMTDEALALAAERLQGMRMAARQLAERMRWYDAGEAEAIDVAVLGDLLGERVPEDLDTYCAAVASRSSGALSMLRQLLDGQQAAEVQVISWLTTRLQQLLMYRWFTAKRDGGALQKSRVFGDARRLVPAESKHWKVSELIVALARTLEAEMLLKGASVEDKRVVLERLTLDLVTPGRLEGA
jgi:DNA polymerase III subunit delta